MSDPYDLARFVAAQDSGGTYAQAVAELRRGRKTSHWMWFVFPQVAGLGHSVMARRYAIESRDEAVAYLAHPTLGSRLRACTELVLAQPDGGAGRVFGSVDAMKLRSSMTLFDRAAPDETAFGSVIDRHFHGQYDSATDRRL